MTGFNIDNFKSQGLIYGGARPSLFQVVLAATPAGVPSVSSQLSFLARSASLPAMSVDEIPIPYFGRHIKIAGERTFQDWSITVMNDEDFDLRNMFEAWNNLINTLLSNRLNGEVPGDYKVNADIQQFGKAGPGDDTGVIRSYTFVGLWPTNVGAIGLDWDATNAIETFDVNFAYDYFIPNIIGNNAGYNPALPPDSVLSTAPNASAPVVPGGTNPSGGPL